MSILSYNGSSIIAMTGKDCVAIASDLRFGVQNQTNAVDMKKIFKIHDHLYCGLAGLATDMQTLAARFAFRHKLYKLREERNMSPVTFAHFVSTLLYEKRFGPYYCEPVIAGLQPDGTPYVTGMDLIGAMAPAEDFVVSGNNTDALLGVCESMYKPGLAAEDLFEVISQCLQAATGRDCLSGWGGVVHVITKEGVMTRTLRGRMD